MSTNDNIAEASHDWLALVREQIGSLRYGEVRITVHERKVTQIERTERHRFENNPTPSAPRPLEPTARPARGFPKTRTTP